MHADELETDDALVRRLLAGQFPQWAELPIEALPAGGTDNAIYRLGDQLSVRLPRRRDWAAGSLDKEFEWLPKLAPLLPLAVPTPVARGAAGDGYPHEWAVYNWLDGEDAASVPLDLHRAAGRPCGAPRSVAADRCDRRPARGGLRRPAPSARRRHFLDANHDRSSASCSRSTTRRGARSRMGAVAGDDRPALLPAHLPGDRPGRLALARRGAGRP